MKKKLIVNPLQTGGLVPSQVKNKLLESFSGYPFCLYCPGDVHRIQKPNIKKLIEEDLPEFLECDLVRLTHGAREGAFLILFALYKEEVRKNNFAPAVLLDGNAHYSMILACERIGLEPYLTSVSPAPERKINEEEFINLTEKVRKKYGKPPLAMLIGYPDGKYTNFPDLKKIAKIREEIGCYFILNCAYSVGRMPFSLIRSRADALIASAHKSMACIGPLGLIGTNEELGKIITRKSKYFPKKEMEFLGCSGRGLPTLCLYYVFPFLKKRIKEWNRKIKIANYFIEKAEKELGFVLQGEKPHRHDVLNFETKVFYEISLRIKDRFFLYKELKDAGILGIKPGITKVLKLSTYLLNKEEVDYVLQVLQKIIKKYGKKE